MSDNITRFFEPEALEPPATKKQIKELEGTLGIAFPSQYREFMLQSNGAEGGPGENSYLALWHIEEIVELNEGYGVQEYTPGLVFFGSDGGGMAYAFDCRAEEIAIVTLPLDSIHIEEAEFCGHTFEEFFQKLYLDPPN